jgi:hypothetical protein
MITPITVILIQKERYWKMANLSEQLKASTCRAVEDRLDERVKGKTIDMTVPLDGHKVRVIGTVQRLAIVEKSGVLSITFIVGSKSYNTPLWYFLANCSTNSQSNGKVISDNPVNRQQLIIEGLDMGSLLPEEEEDFITPIIEEDDGD